MKYISRINYYGYRPCWQVRFPRYKNGCQKCISQKRFHDDVYGGKGKALVYARQWRDKEYKSLQRAGFNPKVKMVDKVPPIYKKPWRTNTSGKVGVFKRKSKCVINGKTYDCSAWIATWYQYMKNGTKKKRTKTFTISRWGDQAFNLACDYREKMERYLMSKAHKQLRLRHGK